ncbi:MAG: hypothetical protein WC551_09375 [Patescibacteria group bacterium]
MISFQKEKKVRSLLRTGLADREIARLAGVEHHTVAKMRRSIAEAQGIPATKVQRIKALLQSGLSVGAVEIRTGVCRDVIKAIRRTCYLQRRKSDGTDVAICPTCGAVMLPATAAQDEEEEVMTSESHGLLQVVEDLMHLQRLNVIYHPLFISLAHRAEQTINSNGGSREAHNAK